MGSSHVSFPDDDYPGEEADSKEVWIDKASMAASISAKDNVQDWKKLIYKCNSSGNLTENIDTVVPLRMRESVEKLISKTTFLDNSYFEVVLTQLQTFLDMIAGELHQELVSEDIANLCNFEYSMEGIKFKNHDSNNGKWADTRKFGGLFGYNRNGTEYQTCLTNFKNHLLDEFKSDWRKITPGVVDDSTKDNYIGKRDYHYILLSPNYDTAGEIGTLRDNTLSAIWGILNYPPVNPPNEDIIDQIFGYGTDVSNKVRYINVIKTSIDGNLVGMLVADDTCNLFVSTRANGNAIVRWYTFDAQKQTMNTLLKYKISSDTGNYVFEPKLKFTDYPISTNANDWLFKMLNRDFVRTSRISDAFAIHCKQASETDQALWYVPQLGAFIYGANSTRP